MLARSDLQNRFSSWAVLLLALPLCVGVAAWGLSDPVGLADWAGSVTGVAFRALDWLYMLVVTGFLVLAVWLAAGRYGSVKPGSDDEQPEFSRALAVHAVRRRHGRGLVVLGRRRTDTAF